MGKRIVYLPCRWIRIFVHLRQNIIRDRCVTILYNYSVINFSKSFKPAKEFLLLPLVKLNLMEAIKVFKNEANDHRLMQIDLDVLAKDQELLEDVYDIIAIELRKYEETIPWEQAKQELMAERKW